MDFAAQLAEHKGFPTLILSGELDIAVERSLEGTVADLVDHHLCAIASVSEVTYSDAASLGMLLSARNTFSSRNGTLAFVCCQSNLLNALESLGFARQMDMFDNLDEAADYLRKHCA